MTRQTIINQIVTMTAAGMVRQKEIPDNLDEFFSTIKNACSSLLADEPTDEEINVAFKSGMPIEFSELLATIAT